VIGAVVLRDDENLGVVVLVLKPRQKEKRTSIVVVSTQNVLALRIPVRRRTILLDIAERSMPGRMVFLVLVYCLGHRQASDQTRSCQLTDLCGASTKKRGVLEEKDLGSLMDRIFGIRLENMQRMMIYNTNTQPNDYNVRLFIFYCLPRGLRWQHSRSYRHHCTSYAV